MKVDPPANGREPRGLRPRTLWLVVRHGPESTAQFDAQLPGVLRFLSCQTVRDLRIFPVLPEKPLPLISLARSDGSCSRKRDQQKRPWCVVSTKASKATTGSVESKCSTA